MKESTQRDEWDEIPEEYGGRGRGLTRAIPLSTDHWDEIVEELGCRGKVRIDSANEEEIAYTSENIRSEVIDGFAALDQGVGNRRIKLFRSSKHKKLPTRRAL